MNIFSTKLSVFITALFCITALSVFSYGQKAKLDHSYKLGSRTVLIPAPDGFIDTMVLYPRIAARLIASDVPSNEVLAVHVEDTLLPELKNGGEPDLPIYTKASIVKSIKETDLGPAEFKAIVSEIRKQAPTFFDANSPALKKALTSARASLNEHWKDDVGFNIEEPKFLGHFDQQTGVFSTMMLMTVEIHNRNIPMLTTFTAVHVNKRFISLYAFRVVTSDKDAETLREFTKTWTGKVVAANK